MSTISENAKAIFLEAVEKHSPEQWHDFLNAACGDDRELRGHVEGLLHAHAEQDSLFDRVTSTHDYQPLIRPGQSIGPYKVREQIGDGGMGVVFVAEQEKPLRRKVALKVIKPGMDSKAVLARFDAERNALALMNHPNIAKVLDAGTTEQGHPYFVMELIQGKPMTEYCDQKRLTINQRLRLFTQICNAVQHAHQKGVIHRDLKPTNILVTEIDGQPVPKVIDFGVAKALGANLTDRTVYTSFQSLIGTPLYMSPEQTQLSGVDVDTSSDVYSLGILLYELLTGTTPINADELKQAAQDEVLRRIRETEPPRPSNRISSLGKTSTQVSDCRSAQPEQLGRLVRGDLDWIVMKALEKDRNRRYKTADAFAADISRHLTNEPVEARPPSTAYRLSRMYRRHRSAVLVSVLVISLLIVGVIGTTTGWMNALKQQRELKTTLNKLYQVLADQALNATFSGDFEEATDSINRAELAEAPRDLTDTLRGVSLLISGDSVGAVETLELAVKRTPNSVTALAALSWAYLQASQYGRHESCQDEVQQLVKERLSVSDYDALFVGLSEFVDGDEDRLSQSHARMNELIARRKNWGVAYLLRAKIRGQLAMEERSLDRFSQAIDDYNTAIDVLDGSAFATTEGLMIFVNAIALADYQNKSAQSERWRAQANSVVEELNWTNAPARQMGTLAAFHFHYGNAVVGEQIEQRVVKYGSQEWILAPETLEYSADESPMNDWRSAIDDPGKQTCLALTLACSSPGPKELSEIDAIVARELGKERPTAGYVLMTDVALVLNDQTMLERICAAARDSNGFDSDYRWWRRYVEFQSGSLDERDFLKMAEPFPFAATFAYYAIAMRAMGDRDFEKAAEFFQKTIDTRTVTYWCYHNAKFFKKKIPEFQSQMRQVIANPE